MSSIHSLKILNESISGLIVAQGETVELAFDGHQSAGIVVNGVWTGQLVVEGSSDEASTWIQCWVATINQEEVSLGLPRPSHAITANGTYEVFQTAGFTQYRVRSTVDLPWTGVATVNIAVVNAPTSFSYTLSSIRQEGVLDPNNSSQNNLTGGDTFIGSATSTLGVAGIQVSLKTDRNCYVYVEQAPDNLGNWDISDFFKYNSANGGDSWTVQAVSAYCRIRVTNYSTSDTTFLRLNTTLCPIIEAFPRTLTPIGSLKTSVEAIENADGHVVKVTPNGELATTGHARLTGGHFHTTTFDTNLWTKVTQTGSADATLANETLTLTTGATANSSMIVQSSRKGRFLGGCSNYYNAIIRVPAVVINSGLNIRRWGAFDATDGFFFQTDGTDLRVVCRKAANDSNYVQSANFNGRWGGDYTLDQNVHTFEIYWDNTNAWFYIDGELLHKFTGSTATLHSSLTLLIGFQNTNAGGNDGVNTLECREATINRLGPSYTRPTWKNQAGIVAAQVLKYGPGTLHKLIIGTPINNAIITIYDATSATNPITTIRTTSSLVDQVIPFDLDFYSGLCFSTNNAGLDVTFVYE